MSNKKQCCCRPQDCPDGNCPSIDADCQTKGLQPFTLTVEATMFPSTCNYFDYEVLECNPSACTSWNAGVEFISEGCLPCDPDIGCEPCRSEENWIPPPGYSWPIRNCLPADPRKQSEWCELPYQGFWYALQSSPEECAPLGSVTCIEIGVQPAGVYRRPLSPIVGSGTYVYDAYNRCGDGVRQQLPKTGGPVFGKPCECAFNPLCQGCPCACNCTANWDAFSLMNPQLPTGPQLDAKVLWVAPCGGSRPGQTPEQREVFNCGGGCDCDGSYIALSISAYFETVFDFPANTPGYDAYFPIPGIRNDGGADDLCIAAQNAEPGACSKFQASNFWPDITCFSGRNLEIVFRRKMDITQLPSNNLCKMLPGEYEPVGFVICNGGPDGPLVCCDQINEDCTGITDRCWDALGACEDPAQWRNYLWKNGLSQIRVVIS